MSCADEVFGKGTVLSYSCAGNRPARWSYSSSSRLVSRISSSSSRRCKRRSTISSITALSRSYQPLTPGQEREQLLSFGLDEGTAGFVVTLNANLRDGAMAPTPGDLAHLIRRPTEPLATTMKTWI
jgi:NAD(P)H dehydrogenase (quinone)